MPKKISSQKITTAIKRWEIAFNAEKFFIQMSRKEMNFG